MWPWLPQGATWLGTGDVYVLTGQKVSRFEAPLYPMMLPPGTWGWYPMTDLSAPTGACAGYRPCLLAGDPNLMHLLCGHGWDVELHTKLPVFMGPPPGKDSDVSLLSKSHAVPPKYAVTQD